MPVDADEYYDKGVQFYNRGDYRQACTFLEHAIQDAPDNSNALYYDALTWHQLKNWSVASQRYKQVTARFPNTAAAARARDALKVLDPSYVASAAPQGAGAVIGKTAHRQVDEDDDDDDDAPGPSGRKEDMSSLPDKASFFFTRNSGGHMVVDLTIDGHPVKAWFDTGASAYFYKQQLEAAGVNCNKAVPAGFSRGWAGVPTPILGMAADVKLGTLSRRINIKVEPTTSGLGMPLIGQDLIRGYQYEIDDKAGRVNLRKTIGSDQKVDSLYDVPCVLVNSKDIVQIEINGHKVPAFIDTGASSTILDALTAQYVGVEKTGDIMHGSGVGGSITMEVATANVRIGPVRKDGFHVMVGGAAGTCIGQDFMEGWRFKVDREHNLLRFFH